MLLQLGQLSLSSHNGQVLAAELLCIMLLSASCSIESFRTRPATTLAKLQDPSAATQEQLIELLRRRAHQDATQAVVKALGETP